MNVERLRYHTTPEFKKKLAIATLWVVMGLCMGGMTYVMIPIPLLAAVPVVLGLALAQYSFVVRSS